MPAEGVVVAVVDPLSVGPKLFKEASKQSVWLMFNEKSVRERKQIVRAGAYSQQMLCNLYSEKPLSLTMPEVERKIYPGFSHGPRRRHRVHFLLGPFEALASSQAGGS